MELKTSSKFLSKNNASDIPHNVTPHINKFTFSEPKSRLNVSKMFVLIALLITFYIKFIQLFINSHDAYQLVARNSLFQLITSPLQNAFVMISITEYE